MFKIPLGFARVSVVDKRLVLCLLSALLIFLGVSHAPFFNRDPWLLSLCAMIFIFFCMLKKAMLVLISSFYFRGGGVSLRLLAMWENLLFVLCTFCFGEWETSYSVKLPLCKQLPGDWQQEKWEQSCVSETSLMWFKQGQVSSLPSVCDWQCACHSVTLLIKTPLGLVKIHLTTQTWMGKLFHWSFFFPL